MSNAGKQSSRLAPVFRSLVVVLMVVLCTPPTGAVDGAGSSIVTDARTVVFTQAALHDEAQRQDPAPLWRALPGPSGLGCDSTSSIAVHPELPSTAVLGMENSLWTTDDAGATWRLLLATGLVSRISSIAIDPLEPERMWIGTGDTPSPSNDPPVAILTSTNGGSSWLAAALPRYAAAATRVHDLFLSRSTSTLLAATDAGLWRSTDGGLSFSNAVHQGVWTDIEAMGAPGPELLALGPTQGICSSDDDGQSWSCKPTIVPPGIEGVPKLATAPADGRAYIAGWDQYRGLCVWRSSDFGATFARVADEFPLMGWGILGPSIVTDPRDGAHLLLGASEIHESTDGGRSWVQIEGEGLGITGVSWSTTDPGWLWLGSRLGALLSTDAGATVSLTSEPTFTGALQDLESHPTNPDIVAVSVLGGGVWLRSDGGSWSRILDGNWPQIRFDRFDPDRMYAGGSRGEVLSSGDGGRSWTSIEEGLPETIYPFVLTVDSSLAHGVWTVREGRVFFSATGGRDWVERSTPGVVLEGSWVYVRAFTQSLSDPQVLAAAINSTLCVSSNGGLSWEWRGQGLPYPIEQATIRDIAFDPHDPQLMLVAFTLGEPATPPLFRSTDQGRSWLPVETEVAGEGALRIEVDATQSGHFFVASERHVWSTTDGGRSWRQLGRGLADVAVVDIAVHGGSGLLRAATYRLGLWELDLRPPRLEPRP